MHYICTVSIELYTEFCISVSLKIRLSMNVLDTDADEYIFVDIVSEKKRRSHLRQVAAVALNEHSPIIQQVQCMSSLKQHYGGRNIYRYNVINLLF